MLWDLDFKANRQMGPLSSPFADEEPEVKEAENKPTSQLLTSKQVPAPPKRFQA